MYDFLLVINSNFGRISYRFRDIDTFSSKNTLFLPPSLVWRPLAAERHDISTWSLHHEKVHLVGYNFVADISEDLSSFI